MNETQGLGVCLGLLLIAYPLWRIASGVDRIVQLLREIANRKKEP